MRIISTIHDPEARLLPLFRKVKGKIGKKFKPGVVSYTSATNKALIREIKQFGFEVAEGGSYGESRKKSLAMALKNSSGRLFCCDFDKIIHWYLTAPQEITALLNSNPREDFFIAGRTVKAFASYPESWQETESRINRLVSKIIGQEVDLMTAVFIFNREGAEIITKNAVEKSWGAASEWPLLAFKHGLKIGYGEFEGLSWEDPERFQGEIKQAGSFEKWKTENYDSLAEWEKRVSSVMEQIGVIQRLFG